VGAKKIGYQDRRRMDLASFHVRCKNLLLVALKFWFRKSIIVELWGSFTEIICGVWSKFKITGSYRSTEVHSISEL
jgi:hypothetical protein